MEQPGHLDAIDARILGLLVTNARLSARAIARQIGMSPGAIAERVARLERTGVIRGYYADVNPEALGIDIEAFVGLQIEQGPPLSEIIERLISIPEVGEILIVTGRWDIVLKLHARNHSHLQELILERVWKIPGFRHSETMLTLRSESRPQSWLQRMLVEPKTSSEQ